MQAFIYPMSSGSRGNSVLLQTASERILIDAGTSCRYIHRSLADIGVSLDDLDAIVLTHEHTDHIAALKVLSRHARVPVYASYGTTEALIEGAFCDPSLLRPFAAGSSFEIGGTYVTSFSTPHDARDSVGFCFETEKTSLGYATDLGMMTEDIFSRLSGCPAVLLESNHDIRMLREGPYPPYLKRRILSECGHLSNDDSARTVSRLAEAGMRTLILGHLSEENNRPEIAYRAAREQLIAAGADPVDIHIAKAKQTIAPVAID